jgi:hypothetical protein
MNYNIHEYDMWKVTFETGKNFLSFTSSRSALGPTQTGSFPMGKAAGE